MQYTDDVSGIKRELGTILQLIPGRNARSFLLLAAFFWMIIRKVLFYFFNL